jgi:hypothetical protein
MKSGGSMTPGSSSSSSCYNNNSTPFSDFGYYAYITGDRSEEADEVGTANQWIWLDVNLVVVSIRYPRLRSVNELMSNRPH